AGGLRVVFGGSRNPRGQRKPDAHRGGRPVGVGSTGQLPRLRGGSKGARTHHAPCVNRPETRMNSPSVFIEDLKDVGNKLGRHDSHLLMHEGGESVSFAGPRVISNPWSERLEIAPCRSSSGRMLRRPAPVDRFHSSTALSCGS